ncbi:MAG: transcription antitermination factor NusB [Phycisphaerales bacterium]
MIAAQRVRVAAFQILYGLDANAAPEQPSEELLETLRTSVLEESEDLAPRELRQAEKKAIAAYAGRAEADTLFETLSPAWPVSRQPAVDRAILRLGYHEMASGSAPKKVAIDEAVELARRFSTEKSPGFVNALLDAAMRKLDGAAVESVEPNAC